MSVFSQLPSVKNNLYASVAYFEHFIQFLLCLRVCVCARVCVGMCVRGFWALEILCMLMHEVFAQLCTYVKYIQLGPDCRFRFC